MKTNKVIFITPMLNSEEYLPELVSSIISQKNQNWEHVIVDDMSTDKSYEKALELTEKDSRFKVFKSKEKKYPVRITVEESKKYQDEDVIIAMIDSDDALMNDNTVDIILSAYNDEELDTAWTAHYWDIHGMNISGDLYPDEDPYKVDWTTSHLKTFRSNIIKDVSDKNFKDDQDEWFKFACDQVIYLPLLYISRKRKFISDICYLYRVNLNGETNINSHKQKSTVDFIRKRGFVK
jgi:glycosyltransferase involved in cell wall biosynthesis